MVAFGRSEAMPTSESVALVLIAEQESERSILVERVDDGVYALPCTRAGMRPGTYRSQLRAHLAAVYGSQSRVTAALQAATVHRAREQGGTSLFVAALHTPTADEMPAGTGFVRMQAGLSELMDERSGHVVRCVTRMSAAVRADNSPSVWRGLWEGLRRVERQMQQQQVALAAADSPWESAPTVPTYDDAPCGPALCCSETHVQAAAGRMAARLRKHEGVPLTVDLEGELGGYASYIALLQACVDGVDEQGETEQLVYVFDTHLNKQALRARGPDTLCALLEDPRIPKSLHCCSGDAASLHREYGIKLNYFLDTGLADMLLRRREPKQQRNLAKVLRHWVSGEVQLTHKGAMEFVPGMFNERPLTLKNFTYAHEDVSSGGRLHNALVRELRAHDIEELAFAMSQTRSPAYAVRVAEPLAYPVGTRVAVALVDDDSVACLCHRERHDCCIAEALAAEITPVTTVVKQMAQHTWSRCMGPPPKGVAAAVKSRPKKPVQIGEVLLFVAVVPSCTAVLEALNSALAATIAATEYEVVVRSRVCAQAHSAGVRAEQRALFQYLYVEADRQQHKRNGAYAEAYVVSTADGDEQRTVAVRANLTVVEGRVCAGLFIARRAARVAATGSDDMACIAIGPTTTGERGALILHDDELVFVLNGASAGDAFVLPSSPVEVGGTAQDAAVRGFDTLAGAALRRGASNTQSAAHETCVLSGVLGPMLSRRMEALQFVGRFGNTAYFACVLQKGTLRHYASAFFMARQPVAGFRLTATMQRRHCGFQLCRTGTALERLAKFDSMGMQAALQSEATVSAESQGAGVAMVAQLLEATMHGADTPGAPEAADEAQHSDGEAAATRQRGLPPLGEDEDLDALFMARVAIVMHGLEASEAASGAQHSDEHFSRVCAAAECMGGDMAQARTVLERHELVQAQWEHTETSWLLERLVHGTIAEAEPEELTAQQASMLAAHELAADGLLRRRTAKGWRVAVPPDRELRNRLARRWHARREVTRVTAYYSFAMSEAVSEAQHSDGEVYNAQREGGQQHKHRPLERAEILQAQWEHPGTSWLLERLAHGTVAEAEPEELTAEQQATLDAHALAEDGLLLRRTANGLRIVVPPALRTRVFRQCHDAAGHLGVAKSMAHVARLFAWAEWKQMRAELAAYIRTCDPCQRSTIHHQLAGKASLAQHGEGPCLAWAMDEWSAGLTADGYDGLLNFMCLFSHLVVSEPVDKHLTGADVCRIIMDRIVNVYGIPEEMRSDADTILTADVVQELYKVYGIAMRVSSAYTHRSIGGLERFHSVLKKMVMAKRIQSGDDEWTKFVGHLVYAYNNTVSATGYTPFFVVFGRDGGLPIDAAMRRAMGTEQEDMPQYIKKLLDELHVVWDAQAQALLRNSLRNVRKMNLKYDVNEEFRVGDMVLLKKGTAVDNLKMHAKAVEVNDGPYRVLEILPQGNVRLGSLGTRRIKDVVDEKRLTRYYRRLTDEETERGKHKLERRWAIEAVVGRQVRAGAPWYKVRWLGFDKKYDRWFAQAELHEIWELVNAYDRAHGVPATLSAESREVSSEQPAADARARARAHFRPTDPERRRQAAVQVQTEGIAGVPSLADDGRDAEDAEQRRTEGCAEGAEQTEQVPAPVPVQQKKQRPKAVQPKAGHRFLIPRAHWPDYPCTEHGGVGWEVEVIRATSVWSKCRFIHSGSDGRPWDAVWRKTADLIDISTPGRPVVGQMEAWAVADRSQREQERRARLTAERARREQRAEQQRGQRGAVPTAGAAAAAAAAQVMVVLTPEGTVQLRASDGSVTVSVEAARLAGTLKAMLEGPSEVEGAEPGVIELPELTLGELAPAVRYMEFKLSRQSGNGATQRFEIAGENAVAVFRAASYLDL